MELKEGFEKSYVESGGNHCPVCGSSDISSDRVEIDGSQGYGNVTCNKCNSTWTDIYRLTGIDNVEVGG